MIQPSQDQVRAGQAVYTRKLLSIYDLYVLGFSNRFIWQCPSRNILSHYNRLISGNHLDVGVGTGYFLDRCQFPSNSPRVALMDLNPNSLAFASQRIARYRPEAYRQSILEPIEADIPGFDSVGVNYLLHCLPGSMTDKTVAFDYLLPLMNPGAVLFGSTLLQAGVHRSRAAIKLMDFYNRKGIFSNTEDSLTQLEKALSQRFSHVAIETVGCVALFSGRC